MLRFRFTEDERRFHKLLSEIYRQCALHLPPQAMTLALRNFGKLQDLLLLEGIRQGIAAADLATIVDSASPDETPLRSLKAFQVHALVYGSTDTPMRSVELELLKRYGFEPDHDAKAWLDANPMRFAPETYGDIENSAPPSRPGQTNVDPQPTVEDGNVDDEFVRRLLGLSSTPPEGTVVEAPDALDRLRDVIQERRLGGWTPTSWTALIMDLHLAAQMDAGFLDLQLSTPMGQTVLAQCGIHLNPGAGMFLEDVLPLMQTTTDEQPETPEKPSES